MGNLLARATRRATLSHVRHVTPVPPGAASGLVARVYRQVERDFGMLAPPIALHAPAPAALAASWVMLRESLLAAGLVRRTTKETVATAISLANQCPYCVEVHSVTLTGLLPGADPTSIAADRLDQVTDPALRAVARWARSAGTDPGAELTVPAGQASELIGVAVVFEYLNRMVNLFLQPSLLPSALPDRARATVMRVAARIMRTLAGRPCPAGTSLELLPPAPLSPDLSWATRRPEVADAFARASAAIEDGGARTVPDRVRELLLARLAEDRPLPAGLSSRAWLDPAVGSLPHQDRAPARLALLTAFAAYQVTDALVAEVGRQLGGDQALIELTAWASLAAARRTGTRLHRLLA
ncbi:MAG TPA: carboxymuconolactone decarboxylase family protein [Micromonosporaceae bacterium]